MLDSIGVALREVSRQFWVLLGPLVAGDSAVHTVFGNCPKHNGLDAWRRVAEPVSKARS